VEDGGAGADALDKWLLMLARYVEVPGSGYRGLEDAPSGPQVSSSSATVYQFWYHAARVPGCCGCGCCGVCESARGRLQLRHHGVEDAPSGAQVSGSSGATLFCPATRALCAVQLVHTT
jgi:hypothetical protein